MTEHGEVTMTDQEAINVLGTTYHLDCTAKQAIKECEARVVAIEALKKQIPEKPIDMPDEFGDCTLVCPACRKPVINYYSRRINPPHCMMCGQKLSWEVSDHEPTGKTERTEKA